MAVVQIKVLKINSTAKLFVKLSKSKYLFLKAVFGVHS